MTNIFLLYEGQALPIRCRSHARARGIRLTCALGGDLLLTAPPGTPREVLYGFLEDNRERIGRQVMEARRRAESLPSLEEDVFPWLGKALPVHRHEGARSQARLTGDHVSLSLVKGDWPQEALERLRRRLALPYLTQLAQERARELGLGEITVVVRPMFSRYGSCQRSGRRLCFNSYLTRMPPEVIRSVIDHELCHLAHAGHDDAFYRALYRICPEYDAHRARLKAELSPYLANVRLSRRARQPHPALADFSSPIL